MMLLNDVRLELRKNQYAIIQIINRLFIASNNKCKKKNGFNE